MAVNLLDLTVKEYPFAWDDWKGILGTGVAAASAGFKVYHAGKTCVVENYPSLAKTKSPMTFSNDLLQTIYDDLMWALPAILLSVDLVFAVVELVTTVLGGFPAWKAHAHFFYYKSISEAFANGILDVYGLVNFALAEF